MELAFLREGVVEGEDGFEDDSSEGREGEGQGADYVWDGEGVDVGAVEGVGGEGGEGGEVLGRIVSWVWGVGVGGWEGLPARLGLW